MVASREGWREGLVRDSGMDMHTLLYLKGTAHAALFNVMWQPGLEVRMDTRTCMAESLCCSPATITALLICYFPVWVSLVAHLVKSLPAIQETWVRSLGWEDPLEKGKATYSSILAWRTPWIVHGVAKSWTGLSDFQFHFLYPSIN